jgi:hypothetical protein
MATATAVTTRRWHPLRSFMSRMTGRTTLLRVDAGTEEGRYVAVRVDDTSRRAWMGHAIHAWTEPGPDLKRSP